MIGTSIRERLCTPLPVESILPPKCLLPLLFFLLTVMFFAELGLYEEGKASQVYEELVIEVQAISFSGGSPGRYLSN